jgi:hypothetical protein
MKFLFWLTLLVAIIAWASFAVIYSKPAATVLKQFVSPGPLSPKHAYLADSCSSCHESTVGVTVTKCSTCHAADEALLGRQPTAFHASVAECATCHVEHQRTSIRPLTLDHALLARIGARQLESAAPQDKESSTTLHSLQTWLRPQSPTDMDLASAAQTLDCAGCHDRQEPHFKRFGSDCAQCHGTETWTVPGYQHPSPRSKECVQCHQAPPSHAMGHFSMVSQKKAGKEASVDRCFECHLTTSWNDIAGVGFYKHH